jgi:hypothetical protein
LKALASELWGTELTPLEDYPEMPEQIAIDYPLELDSELTSLLLDYYREGL